MRNVYSVGQVNHYVKNMFTQDYFLRKVYVKGEVSNCKYHTSGHIYFSLKDETGTLSCVMFAGHRRGLAFRMKDGDKVVAGGIVDTDMNKCFTEKDIEAICDEIPAGRMCTPKEVAEVVLHIIDSSPYLTGQIITVDGGWT